jgi:uncharacterized damage-inducible protein DinB
MVDLQEFLTAPIAHLAPAKVIEGLDARDAERRVDRTPHSIAEIVAHLTFWQAWFHARCTGRREPMPASAAVGWPNVDPGSWPSIEANFLERLAALTSLASGDVSTPVSPAIEFPPLAKYTIADALVHAATHNAHHLGQVVTLRQLLGAWPPPAGSWTW